MDYKPDIEDLIVEELTLRIEESKNLNIKDKKAIYQEYREWIEGVYKEDDIWVITRIC